MKIVNLILKLQHVIRRITKKFLSKKHNENKIFHKYIEKCHIFYVDVLYACIYLTATAFIIGPVLSPVSFPADAEYVSSWPYEDY